MEHMPISPTERNKKIVALLTRNVEQIIERDHLEKALASGKKLRVKLGIDPTGTKIHIGRAVPLWKLKEFQDLGHKIVLIIGDFTAQVGDPSDKLEKRPFLTKAQVKTNLKNYLAQIGKIINLKKAEIHYNSKWLGKLTFQEISELAEIFSIQQMVERRNFKERWEKHEEISLREFMYPLMQGYDSVMVKADVEMGGTNQLFNLMAGRKIQERYGQKPQDIITFGMINGLDGRKMSTSWGNVINIADEPGDQYGKVMSARDEMIVPYFRTATGMPEEEIALIEQRLKKGENPKLLKEKLAHAVVARYHGNKAADRAAENFVTQFTKKETPREMPVLSIPADKAETNYRDLVVFAGGLLGVVKSNGEAWRKIEQGGFELNGEVKADPKIEVVLKTGDIGRIGRHYFRILVED
jgi:tyrosyl-tRNA synthetase